MFFITKRPYLLYVFVLALAFSADLFVPNVLGASSENLSPQDFTENPATIKTTSAFNTKEVEEYEELSFEIKYESDPETEYGNETVTQEGKLGLKTSTYKITYWQDELIDKQLVKTKVDEPSPKIISKGTKIVWRLLPTPEYGRVKYWYKMRVWATKYDANCEGCTGRTYSGTEVKQGVCATDPKVISLGTNFYVPGYGVCRAEDIGGAIKGNKIDLGFVDASKGNWGAQYTDIYLLSNEPQ